MYSCMKMWSVETIPGIGGWGIKQKDEQGELTIIYCKNVGKQLKKDFKMWKDSKKTKNRMFSLTGRL
jgi:hypothetical protein